MPDSQFSEDEFEDNLLHELQHVYGKGLPHFKPSRTIENALGYDFAVNTGYWVSRRPNVLVNDPRWSPYIRARLVLFYRGDM